MLRLARTSGVLGILGALVGGCAAPRPTNLLLVTLDTLRADHLGCYGYARPTSPVLDRLARRSLVFEHAVAQSAVTPVSHASILSGLAPRRHGLRSLHGGAAQVLAPEVTTLAERLRDAGFATAGFVSAFTASRHFGLDQGFDTWDEAFLEGGGADAIDASGIVNTGRAQRRADETTDRALAWLGGVEPPFFQWIHYFDVHDPLLLPPPELLARFPPASEGRKDRLRAIYDAEIAWVDRQVGRVLEGLRARGLRDRTVVVVVADHGEGLGDHGWWGHTILFQEQVRVPLLLSAPAEGWTGRVAGLVRTTDLVPTLLDLLGVGCGAAPCDFDGRSVRPLVEGGAPDGRIATSETLDDLAAYGASPLRDQALFAVNDGRFKLIDHYEKGRRVRSLLFDLATDPGELRDLADARPDVRRRLQEHLDGLGAVVESVPTAPLDPRTRRHLEALGYGD